MTRTFVLTGMLIVIMSATSGAAELRPVGSITVPGEKLTNFDII
jgi:hypothetical protein